MKPSYSPIHGIRIALLAALVASLCPAIAQQPQPRPMNNPVLPQTPWSLKPQAPGSEAPLAPGPGPSGLLNASTWIAIGPASLNNSGFNSISADNSSGRITGIAADPNDPNVLYVAAAGGGVWKTIDGGATWTPLTDSQTTLAMGSIAVAPSNSQKIYAGTGEANNAIDNNHGYGVLVSDDGGATWTLETAGGAFTGNVIGQIAVDPTNAKTAYAAVGSDYSLNGVSYQNAGIWKTTDGGTTWTNTTASLSSQWPWTSVVVDPNTPSDIYAAAGSYSNLYGTNGVFRSTDSGATWAQLANAPDGSINSAVGRIALAVSPAAKTAGEHVLYVAVANAFYPYGLQVFSRSDNADAATPTFTDLTTGTPDFLGGENSGGGQGWYDIAVNVDANGTVYCAGVEDYGSAPAGFHAIVRSTTLGATWDDISIVNNLEPHTDNHAIAFDASGRMLAGNDGGVFRYDPSSGGSWTDLNTNLNTIQFTGIGLHPTSLGIVIGGSQDNGAELYTDNLVWNQVEAGDGGFAQISQTNPTRCYEEYVYGAIERSDSSCGVGTFLSISSGIAGFYSNFYTPYTVDPTNGDHVLLGTDAVNDTVDAGNSWIQIGYSGVNNFNPNDLPIDSIALSPANGSNPAIVYVASGGFTANNSNIFVAQENGASTAWTEIDLPGFKTNPNGFGQGCRVSQIATDPSDLTGKTAFAVTSNLTAGASHVWMTTNQGTAWTDISGNLPNRPTWSVQVDSDANRTVYVSTDEGVYASASPYSKWAKFGAGLPNAEGYDLELNRKLHLLAVGTHGRGAWEIVTKLTPQVIDFAQPASPVTYSAGLTIPLTATGGASGNPVVFSIDGASTGSGTISGNTLTVTDAGTLVIDANQAGGGVFAAAAEVKRTVVVNQITQAILFTQPASPVVYSSGLTIPLTATGGASGNPVVFSIDPSSTGKGSISGSTLTVTGVGTLVLDANQAGDTNYAAAAQVQKTLVVNQGTQTIAFTQPVSPVAYSAGLTITLSATGGASRNPVVFTLDGTSTGTGTISGSTLTVTGVGTFVLDANQTGNTNYSAAAQVQKSLVVNQGTQVITFTQPTSPVAYSSGLTIALSAIGGASGNPVVFSIDPSSTGKGSISASNLAVTGVGTFTLDANQTGNTNYSAAAQVQKSLVVNQAVPAITWAAPAAIPYGTALSAAQLNATAAISGTFAYSPAAGTVLGAGAQTLEATFTPTDATDYASNTKTISLTVNTASLAITVDDKSMTFGGMVPALSGTVTGVVAGDGITAAFSTTATSTSPVGPYPITATLSDPNTKLANYTVTNKPGTLTVNKSTPIITWPAPAAITYGTPLGAAQLNATSTTAGTFAYTPGAGSVLGAGSQTLNAAFAPTDATDYATATGSVTLTVNPATPAIALSSSLSSANVGQSVTLTAAVSSSAGIPTGSVTFWDGTTQLGSGTLAAGMATYATTTLAAGTHSIIAQYSGDADFTSVTSAAFTQTITQFSIGPANGAPTTVNIVPGSGATFELSVTPPGSSAVTFTIAGLPTGATNSFTPGTVPAGSGPTNVQLVINLPGQVAAVPATQPGSRTGMPLALGLLLLPFLGLRRSARRTSRFLLLAILAITGAVGLASLSGCGGHSRSTTNPVTPGAYTLTVTATAGAQTQTTTLTLNVE